MSPGVYGSVHTASFTCGLLAQVRDQLRNPTPGLGIELSLAFCVIAGPSGRPGNGGPLGVQGATGLYRRGLLT